MEGIYNNQAVHPEALIVDAMKIWSLPKNKKHMLSEVCSNGEYFAQIKKDGYWYEFNKTENHSYLFSRNISEKTGVLTEKLSNVPHIKAALDCLPKDTIVIGEIYIPNKKSKDVGRIMSCKADKAISRQNEEGLIKFYIHDMIAFNGALMIDVPAIKRYEALKKTFEVFNLGQYDFLELAEIYLENIQEAAVDALARGEEGMVLKLKNALYTPGKKPAWTSIKIKEVDYADVICLGFKEATKEYSEENIDTWQYWVLEKCSEVGKDDFIEEKRYIGNPVYVRSPLYRTIPVTKPYYYNWKTSIRIGAYDEDGALQEIGSISSGLSDELKRKIAENPNDFIGKIIEVECMSLDRDRQTIRHGRLIRFRDDKNPTECTLVEVFQ